MIDSLRARASAERAPAVRAYFLGRVAGLEHADALARAARPWSRTFTITSFPMAEPWRGKAAQPGPGIEHTVSVAQLVAMHEDLARSSTLKDKHAPSVVHARTAWLGHSNADVVERTALFLDCDLPGSDPAPLLDALVALDVAWVLQARGGKHHIEIPLARPLVDNYADPARARAYQRRAAFAIGFLSSVAGLACEDDAPVSRAGFDGSSPSHVSGLCYPYVRKRRDDPVPVTRSHDGGCALDLEALLEAAGYVEATPRARRPRTVIAGVGEALGAGTFAAFKAAGLAFVDAPTVGAKVNVVCPFEAGHTSGHGENDSSTVLLPVEDGGFIVKCLHGTCAGRSQRDFVEALPAHARALVDQTELSAGRARTVAQLGEPPARVYSLDEAERLLDETLDAHDSGAAVVIRATPGVGKTRALRRWIARTQRPVVVSVPTHALAKQTKRELFDENEIAAQHRRGVLSVLDENKNPVCKKYPDAKRIADAGGSVPLLLCSRCEHATTCVARLADGTDEQRVFIGSHQQAPRMASDLREREPTTTLVFDESPSWVDEQALTLGELRTAIALLDAEDGDPVGNVVADVGGTAPNAFRPAYRALVRPLVETLAILAAIGGEVDAAADRWEAGTRLLVNVTPDRSRSRHLPAFMAARVDRARRARGVRERAAEACAVATSPWERVVALARLATAHRTTVLTDAGESAGFDELTDGEKAKHVLAARIVRVCKLVTSPGVVVSAIDATEDDPKGAKGVAVVALSEAAETFTRIGGVILDATADLAVIRALRQDDVRVVDVDAEDAGDVERVAVYRPRATRRHLCAGEGATARFLGLVGDAVTAASAAGVEHLVIFAFKRALDDNAETLATVAAGALPIDFVPVENTRGLNSFRDADGFATIGDPRPNVGGAERIARALVLPAELDLALAQARGILAQAHGRSRDPQPHPSGRVRHHWHFGALVPEGWHALNSRVEAEPRGGSRVEASTVTVEELRASRLSVRALAAALGCGKTAAAGYLSGSRVLPELLVGAWREVSAANAYRDLSLVDFAADTPASNRVRLAAEAERDEALQAETATARASFAAEALRLIGEPAPPVPAVPRRLPGRARRRRTRGSRTS